MDKMPDDKWAKQARWRQATLLLLTCTLAWLGVVRPGAAEPEPSHVVYPPYTSELIFEHASHTGLACDTCHAAKESIRPADRLLPGKLSCRPCHAEALDDRSRCAECHLSYATTPPEWPSGPEGRPTHGPAVSSAPNAALSFSHRLHVDVPCDTCHASMDREVGASGHRPTMAVCVACHEERGASASCGSCHLTRADGKLKTDLPAGTLVPSGRFGSLDHRVTSLAEHGNVALGAAARCESCHTEDGCRRCHDGVVQPVDEHPTDYLLMHGIDALAAPGTCTSCHGARDFCAACHDRVGLGEEHGPPIGARFHPEGFVDDVGSADFHGPEASRAIDSCVSCHSEETCITCHAALNPHPPDFRTRCESMLERNETACRKCHVGQDLRWIDHLCD